MRKTARITKSEGLSMESATGKGYIKFDPIFWDARQDESEVCPKHRALLCAVIERALRDLDLDAHDMHSDEIQRRNARHCVSAILWFLGETDEPFSFLWVCDQLGLASDTIKKGLQARGAIPFEVTDKLKQAHRELNRRADYGRKLNESEKPNVILVNFQRRRTAQFQKFYNDRKGERKKA